MAISNVNFWPKPNVQYSPNRKLLNLKLSSEFVYFKSALKVRQRLQIYEKYASIVT